MTDATRARSLRREILVWYSVVLLVALSTFAALSYLILRRTLDRAGTETLRQTAFAAEQLIIPPGVPRLGTAEQRVAPGKGNVEALRRRTRLPSGDVVDIYVARSGDVEGQALHSLLLASLALIPLTAAAAAFGGGVIANRLLRPLNRLVDATREIGIAGLSRRIAEPARPAELRDLASAFNAMLARLDGAVDTLRRFTADASHELRTPLTAIKGTIQVALARERSATELRQTLSEVAEETEWMLHLVEQLLTLARGDQSPAAAPLEAVDLVELLTDVREIGEALAAGKRISFALEAPETLVGPGSPAALRRVFLNLVSNAVRFTDRGSVAIRASERDGWAVIEVEDTGTGIAANELPHLFERFYRGDPARGRSGGTGLGLAIARLAVEQHGGSVRVHSVPGAGSTFEVRLPLGSGESIERVAAPLPL